MIKGLAITPPVIGRISIGRVVEKNGKRIPEKEDQFTITSQIQGKEGWIPHPLDEILRNSAPSGKIRSVPVKVLFNDPDLNLRAGFSLFDRNTGRPLCVGNGETCKRVCSDGMQEGICPSPDACEFGAKLGCKPYGRLNVQIAAQEDELGSFVFRTTGFNSIRTLAARLQYFQAISGNLLACLPLEMKLRGKSTTQSHRTPIYYVDLTIREGMSLNEAISQARKLDEERRELGIDQQALDLAARNGFANGAFEESEEEGSEIVEEFFPEAVEGESQAAAGSLKEKLRDRAEKTGGVA